MRAFACWQSTSGNEAAADAAVAGADVVYLTTPEGGANPLDDEQAVVRNVISAAARAGVKHIVLHTALRANRGNTGARILDNKTPLEAARRSGPDAKTHRGTHPSSGRGLARR